MHPKHLRIEDYTYSLPQERIAIYPLQQRGASKLLVYSNGQITDAAHKDIYGHIPRGSLMVFNKTKVVHARLLFKKPTGGIIEIFCLEPHQQYHSMQAAMEQQGKVLWKCMIGGASKWKHGQVLTLFHEQPAFTLSVAIAEKQQDGYLVELSWDDTRLTFAEILHYAGKVPLPPYLNREADINDEDRYQTAFAENEGSVAAPTASLHFTEDTLSNILKAGIETAYLTLHVGAGTFMPVKSETMEGHGMHAEWMDVSLDEIIKIADHLDKGIIAVGTTAARTLESLYWIGAKIINAQPVNWAGIAVTQWDPYESDLHITAVNALNALIKWMLDNNRDNLLTRTQIMIAPGYQFKIINGLVTNFHQPRSTLLLLVAAFIGDDWKKVYTHALESNYRFLSYGDGSLLWKERLNVKKTLPPY
ncbi:MAG: S-adenosylmethionine:tRNA ribosyltransferase-isomerase [Taibaiella sp.]|nr:S-adenosylmethionine:tRNA ribosyltransferase-isomerase [Taibaiella sp.]